MDGTRTLVLVDQMRAVDASRLGDFAAASTPRRPERSTGPSSSCSAFSERPGAVCADQPGAGGK